MKEKFKRFLRRKILKMIHSKKAEAIWLSWVLLLAFVVALSAFMFGWSTERNELFASELRVMADTAECDSIGIRVDDICQNPQSLNMNVSNRDSIAVSQLAMNVYDVYMENPLSREVDVSIRPAESENVRVLKQSTTQEVEIVPVIITQDNKIFCYERALTIADIDYCD